MVRIYKEEARKRYENGEKIYLLPSKARIGSIWISPIMIIKGEGTFDSKVNAFSYYNCSAETGRAVHYYIE